MSATVLQLVGALDNRGIHNFSLSSLYVYFGLQDRIAQGRASLVADGALHISGAHPKTYLFKTLKKTDIIKIQQLQKAGPVYSLDPCPGMQGKRDFKEVVYALSAIFDPAEYKNSKKRHQRLVYPFKWLEREGIEIVPLKTIPFEKVIALHDQWVNQKIEVNKVYRMMFPTGRYIKCAQMAVKDAAIKKSGLLGAQFSASSQLPLTLLSWAAIKGGELLAVRVAGQEGKNIFDLAYFSRYWDQPSQLTNYVNTYILKEALNKGVERWNCGAGLNRSLHDFKTHYPHIEVVSYVYGRIK